MKVFVFAVLVLAAVKTEAQNPQEDIRANVLECLHKTNAGDLAKLKEHEIPFSRSAMSLYACVMKKIGMLNSDWSINMDKTKEMISYSNTGNPQTLSDLTEKFENCKYSGISATEDWEAAQLIMICVTDKKFPSPTTSVEL